MDAVNVEVINTGTELLLGNVVNTHLAFLGRELFPLGLRIARQSTVPDGDAIRAELADSLRRSEIILVTGGLGPTTDDVTREIAAELLGLELDFDAGVMTAIEERFARRAIKMTDRVRRQAMVPRGAAVLANSNGTAPGLHFDFKAIGIRKDPSIIAQHLFLLPGPPRELKPMFSDVVVPVLRKILPQDSIDGCRSYRIAGLGESNVEALAGEKLLAIKGIELGYCARPGEVDVRLIGPEPALDRAEAVVMECLGGNIVSTDHRSLEQVLVELLAAGNKTVAVAESCTGGFIANRITNVPGASKVFVAGLVTYANVSKVRQLGVDAGLIAEHGAVSAEVASAMAEGAVKVSGADYGLSTTGIAGPSGGTPQKPVGTVFVALAVKNGAVVVQQHAFPTDRETFKWLVSQAALDLLRRTLV